MKIESIGISEKVLSRFPAISLGYVIAKNVKNTNSEELEEIINYRVNCVSNIESIDCVEGVVKWRYIFSQMNAKKGKLSSVESLISMCLTNKKLPDINPVVNYYNSLSCYLGLPMGGYNLDSMPQGNVELKQATKGEEFLPIGGKLIEKTSNGEIVYSSGSTIICKLWNNKDAEITKIIPTSNNLLFIFDGADENEKIKVQQGIDILKNDLSKYFNACIISSGILDIQNPKGLI